MSNLIKVPHSVVFEAIIDLDKIPAKLLPALLKLTEADLLTMCKGATVNAISESKFLQIANDNNTWAEVIIKEGN
jgi:hypothetical protein